MPTQEVAAPFSGNAMQAGPGRTWALWGDRRRLDRNDAQLRNPPTGRGLNARDFIAGREAVRAQRRTWDARVSEMTLPHALSACAWRAARLLTCGRAVLNWAVHPVTCSSIVAEREHPGARHVSIWTSDDTLLDGVVLARPGRHDEPLPTLLFALGNGDQYENYLPIAADKAAMHDIRILLYNGRGVGKSLGNGLSTRDAVRDCEAALLRASRMSRDVAVSAYSLGGGISARALERLRGNGALLGARVGLYMNHNSFDNLPHAAGQLMAHVFGLTRAGAAVGAGLRRLGLRTPAVIGVLSRLPGHLLGWVLRPIMWGLGFDILDTEGVLRRTRLADLQIVSYVPNDPVIRDGARLQDAIRRSPRVAEQVQFVFEENVEEQFLHHGRTMLSTDDFDLAVRRWLADVAARNV